MDQKKIGTFIAESRKNKNLTQKELAEKLGVSVNAVSKWERGICLMDMSLLKPLSSILEVSIAEIINGEKDNDNVDNAIESTIDYSKKQLIIERRKKYIVIIASLLIIFVSVLFSYKGFLIFVIDTMEKQIDDINDDAKNYYGSPIYINNKKVENYYTFKNMKIENIFEDKVAVGEYIDSVAYDFDDGKRIVFMTDVSNDYVDVLTEGEDIVDRKYYLNKININSDLDVYKFISEFSKKDFSIFNSVSFLEEYYFECSIYNIAYFSYDEFHEIRGDLTGYVYTIGNNIIYHLINDDIEYSIIFLDGFDFKETLELVSTVSFNNN